MEQSAELRRQLLAQVFVGSEVSATKSRSFSAVVAFLVGVVFGIVVTALIFKSTI